MVPERIVDYRHCALCVSWLPGLWEEVHQAQGLGAQSSEFIHHNVNCGNFTDGLSWAPISFLLIKDGALEETSGLRSAGSTRLTPMLEDSYAGLSFFSVLKRGLTKGLTEAFKKLSSPAHLSTTKKKKKQKQKTVCVKQSLTLEIHSILYFCWGHQLLSCRPDSVQSQTPGRKEQSH